MCIWCQLLVFNVTVILGCCGVYFLEIVESFFDLAKGAFKRAADRKRAENILTRWASAWQGASRNLTGTSSNHGAYLHFNQLIGGVWCKAFTFHASFRHGFSLRGPDTDRNRKSHKFRDNRLNSEPLDNLFESWSLHPEVRPAGNAVELHMSEAHDDVWELFLQEALSCLNEPTRP
jgi:hypothetical protein